jgi:hypothetical protein
VSEFAKLISVCRNSTSSGKLLFLESSHAIRF